MNNQDVYIKYKIEKILDLDELAHTFELNPNELRLFHNLHCEIHQLLPEFLPKYVDYIYLPIENYKNWNSKQLTSSTLILPDLKSTKRYGIVLQYSPQNLSIHYEIEINRNQLFIEINKKETFINHQKVDLIVEQMIEKASEVIFPLQIKINDNGSLNEIVNDKEIRKRWQDDTLPSLQSYYKAEIATDILNKLDHVFSHLNTKKDLILKNHFFQLYFAPIYQNYPNFEHTSQFQIYFSSLRKFKNYRVKYELQKEYSSNNKIVLNVKATDENDFNLTYKFDKETHELFSAIGKFSVKENNIFYEIHFEMYELI
ncbi:hypothetical protein [Empedobacter sedimenti]|uniref:hypothetical protein n=1 Tax=Empedobacter sedimenti TaxID=3042610 RepID=UPI0024A680A1|nr:hypothetical protein [Empedobacter sedimenti]